MKIFTDSPITLNEPGLVCDNKECDYTNDVKSIHYPYWVNRGCPKCGQNLLTEINYNQILRFYAVINFINRHWFLRVLLGPKANTPETSLKINPDGSIKNTTSTLP